MRIGELAERVGVSTDTVRFYERSGWLPRATGARIPTASTATRMSTTCGS